ncbi:calmodulin-lysine N-methyltransferase isoform X3 [Vitis vinifera]|uniref:calmodulin-lysine N-methyltransferase isoform X3 n=1 Tax=Vitis vinifera TaxID=29760 RepID=UPI002882F5CE|nr:calmodulin-lysine N-methyltransferase isoform X3 [Vitis vinifera]
MLDSATKTRRGKSGNAMEATSTMTPRASTLRWEILRRAVLRRPPPQPGSSLLHRYDQSRIGINRISRKTSHGFNLIPHHLMDGHDEHFSGSDRSRDARICYTLPVESASKLYLTQRVDDRANLNDFEICNRYDIDNTGLVCHWPSEDILAYFCLSHTDMFRSKKVIELGSGYGLAGLVIAAVTDALEIVISDGNPQVVDYIQHNIDANCGAFGDTRVKSMTLHWNQEEISNISDTYDIIVASDCTFFKESHKGLARTVKFLLKNGPSEAIFLSPRRGDSLDKFLDIIKQSGLHFSISENYDTEVWKRHQELMNGECTETF